MIVHREKVHRKSYVCRRKCENTYPCNYTRAGKEGKYWTSGRWKGGLLNSFYISFENSWGNTLPILLSEIPHYFTKLNLSSRIEQFLRLLVGSRLNPDMLVKHAAATHTRATCYCRRREEWPRGPRERSLPNQTRAMRIPLKRAERRRRATGAECKSFPGR